MCCEPKAGVEFVYVCDVEFLCMCVHRGLLYPPGVLICVGTVSNPPSPPPRPCLPSSPSPLHTWGCLAGDVDMPLVRGANPRSLPTGPTRCLTVRALARSGAATQAGTLVRLVSSSPTSSSTSPSSPSAVPSIPGPILSTRYVRDGVGPGVQGPYTVNFGVSDPAAPVDVVVSFFSGRTVVAPRVVPGVRALALGCTPLLIRDVPVVAGATLLPPSGVVGIGGVLSVVVAVVGREVRAGQGARDGGCCLLRRKGGGGGRRHVGKGVPLCTLGGLAVCCAGFFVCWCCFGHHWRADPCARCPLWPLLTRQVGLLPDVSDCTIMGYVATTGRYPRTRTHTCTHGHPRHTSHTCTHAHMHGHTRLTAPLCTPGLSLWAP